MTTTIGSQAVTATALDYANGLLGIGSQGAASSIEAYLDPTEFKAGDSAGAVLYHDYVNNQLVFFHPLYTGQGVTGTVSTQTLGPEAAMTLAATLALHAPAGHAYADAAVAMDALNGGLVLVVLGIAVAAAAIALTFATGGTGAPGLVLLFKVGVALIVAGIVVDTVQSIFEPQLVPGSLQSNGGTTCYTISSALGGQQTCISPNGSTTVTPTANVETALVGLAIGVLAVGGGLLAVYIGYRYVSNRPKPGFGNTPPLRQRYPRFNQAVGPQPAIGMGPPPPPIPGWNAPA